MRHFLFLLGLALLITHEIDAALAAEWRLLYVLRAWADGTAATTFVALHVPLFFGLLWMFFHPTARLRETSRLIFMAFLVIHAGLHWRLAGHPLNGFSGLLSSALIYGAGVAGGLFVVLCGRAASRPERIPADG